MAAASQRSSARPIHVSIISNSALLREGLLNLLASYLSFQLVGSYRGDLPVTDALPNPPDHVVLLDNGIGLEAALSRTREWRACAAYVVVLELQDNVEAILSCIEAGANAYTLRGATCADVAETIEGVLRGMVQCPPQITAQLFARLAAHHQLSASYAHLALTARELEVLALIAREYTNKQIAEELVIEVRTVKHHIHNILDKLQMRHRWEAVRYATEQGWISEPTLER